MYECKIVKGRNKCLPRVFDSYWYGSRSRDLVSGRSYDEMFWLGDLT